MIIAIVAFLILLLALVVVHEFGHYWVAKRAGVEVPEFSVGIGPKIASRGGKKEGTTKFSIRALPLGGFVRIKGESSEEDGALMDKDSFIRASFWWKVAMLMGGIVMNIIAAWVIFSFGFWHGVAPIRILPDNAMATVSRSYLMPSLSFLKEKGFVVHDQLEEPARIIDVAANSLASEHGLVSGDIILAINDEKVTVDTIQSVLRKNIGKDISILYSHVEEDATSNGPITKQSVKDGNAIEGTDTKTISLRCPDDVCILGVALATQQKDQQVFIKFPFFKALYAGGEEVRAQTSLTTRGLITIFENIFSSHSKEAVDKLTGPVGAAKVGQVILQGGGWIHFIMFGGLLSMALAIFNVLPIPALDGGRLLGVIIQKVFALPASKYYLIEGYINMIFFALLILLGVFLILHDLVKMRGVYIPFM